MSRTFQSAFVAVLLVVLAPRPGLAETVVCGTTLDSSSSLSWQSAKQAAGAEGNQAAFRILKERYKQAATSWPASIAKPAAEAFAALDAGTNKVSNFEITKSGTNPLALQQGVFQGQPYFVELPIDAGSALCTPSDLKKARIEFATVITGVGDAAGEAIAPGVERVAGRITELEQTFDRYLFEGFPMFPWEAAVNSLVLTKDHIAEGPPRYQIVLAHPAAGMVVSMEGNKSDMGATVSIEPVGFVRYTKDYRHWMGVSLLAVFPADRNAGYGIAFNYDMFKLGVTWHDDNTGDYDGAAVFVGLDLYKFLDAKYREYDGYRDRVRSLAEPTPP